MAQKNKIVKPRFFYDKNQIPIAVYLTIDDYRAFMDRLRKFSEEMRYQQPKIKKTKKKN